MSVQIAEQSLTTQERDWYHMALITLFSLLAGAILIIICLTVVVLRIKGKSSCTKGDITFPNCYVNQYILPHIFVLQC